MLRTEDFAAYKFLPRVLAAAQHLNASAQIRAAVGPILSRRAK
jgi:hypothetical protein